VRIFICHESALEYWRRRRKLPGKSANRRYSVELPDAPAEIGPVLFSGLKLPIHVMLGSQHIRRASKNMNQHIFSSETPIGCFMNIGNDLMISSPEFVFLQLANQLTSVELIELGYELCGVYSLPLPDEKEVPERGFFTRQQLTSTKKLTAFLDSMPGARGRLRALHALRYLQDGSASPMETKLAMLLTLPYKMGGYGFKMPILNCRIPLPKAVRKYFTKKYYVCDLYWPDEKVAVEYDSDQYHTASERIANDSNKRNALASIGIRVVSVTRQQLYRNRELESAARTLARHMGRRLFSKKSSFSSNHLKLRSQLLHRPAEGRKPPQ